MRAVRAGKCAGSAARRVRMRAVVEFVLVVEVEVAEEEDSSLVAQGIPAEAGRMDQTLEVAHS